MRQGFSTKGLSTLRAMVLNLFGSVDPTLLYFCDLRGPPKPSLRRTYALEIQEGIANSLSKII